ncbi:MAG TPA: DUF72 domain-containing protein [Terriglobales bacterium]|nr:DUF72 domain-containing protein [Terriglobales bacterium]
MARLFAGTSGWSYPSWKPDFYPAKLPSKKFLEYYATRLNSVELNVTFRRFATASMQQGWIAVTPADFCFTVKAHQNITHVLRLRNAEEFTRSFLGSLQPMAEAGKLGTVLFQLPPFLKCDTVLLADFLKILPRAARPAFEFRHPSWFSDEVYQQLQDAGAALCIAESEKLEVPEVVTADFTYFRLRKPEYSPAERKEIVEKVGGHLAAGRDVYVYFKHEETPEGARYAEELLKTVQT